MYILPARDFCAFVHAVVLRHLRSLQGRTGEMSISAPRQKSKVIRHHFYPAVRGGGACRLYAPPVLHQPMTPQASCCGAGCCRCAYLAGGAGLRRCIRQPLASWSPVLSPFLPTCRRGKTWVFRWCSMPIVLVFFSSTFHELRQAFLPDFPLRPARHPAAPQLAACRLPMERAAPPDAPQDICPDLRLLN